ncbi:histone-like nucleoid-structuring protein Lsr2 [Rhodococcus chondri]|uniref:Lsr2 family protein n=1 Tax=Rhodococcus chondri TaxID=3065941 RepID=A0ABU7JLK3_9NOCA|nr:Lsr2 family protein [Rhodococcus sp. CC-R104]MEE2030592.1 Lsr2 family protein [Rhodococcus sp. CC-R104]
MAQKMRVEYFDDIDGEPITDGLAQSFRIIVDDVEYELDLRPANADKFWAVLKPWLTEATRKPHVDTPPAPVVEPAPTAVRSRSAGRPRTVHARKKISSGRAPEQLAAVRHWARGQGLEVSSRGRVPRDILERFDAAHA